MGCSVTALDLFAGTGWGVACQQLGIKEYGVEIMPAAIQTREANGMETAYYDVWDGLSTPGVVPAHDILLASPPCQTFSVAGSGVGRKALDSVIAAIDSGAYNSYTALRELTERTDPKTALVLTPLAYAIRFNPDYIAFEQVPSVLPVWERCARVLERASYSVWTGKIHSEQFGVAQTRERAFLIARNDGIPAAPPSPTHSRYYSRDATRLDHGLPRWRTMYDELGWGRMSRPFVTIGGAVGRGRGAGGSGGAAALDPSLPDWCHRRPATTVVGSFNPHIIAAPAYRGPGGYSRQNQPDSVRVTLEEAAALQSYPAGFVWCGSKTNKFLQVGNAVPPKVAKAVLETFL